MRPVTCGMTASPGTDGAPAEIATGGSITKQGSLGSILTGFAMIKIQSMRKSDCILFLFISFYFPSGKWEEWCLEMEKFRVVCSVLMAEQGGLQSRRARQARS